jgi:hypothetical protein
MSELVEDWSVLPLISGSHPFDKLRDTPQSTRLSQSKPFANSNTPPFDKLKAGYLHPFNKLRDCMLRNSALVNA